MGFEFSASRFVKLLQKNLAVVRSYYARAGARGAPDPKASRGLEGFLGTMGLVVSRAEAIMEQILREKLPRPMEAPAALRDILRERVDLVPTPGLNILKVVVHVKGDDGERAVVAHLCSQLTATETRFPGTNLRLMYEPLVAPRLA